MIKKLVLTIVFSCTAFTGVISGAEIRFRSGVIKAAEISNQDIFIRNIRNNKVLEMPEKKCFAVVTVALDKGRSLSIFDYSLILDGKTYPAIALRKNGRFEYFDGSVQDGGLQQLLFVLDAFSVSGNALDEEIVLHCNLSQENNEYDVRVKFRKLGSRTFRKPQEILEAK